ncbi:hypothetical protein GSI_06109 [Ganoderma sinense ZZ0214-1]|uniref:Uncharacterized protein n=1 Tax=Ganoderma sinense ZZ0214-1 TaxID=1077348 RepID=A0A2G8SCU7_9APHY|nr:hypothetical protein GSI_06109 [Ganoderma sinense ZZ0214-1]
MATDGERSMFFAGSDDEGMNDAQPHTRTAALPAVDPPAEDTVATQPSSPTQRPLFFADSDDEEPEPMNYRQRSIPPIQDANDNSDIEFDVEMADFVDVPRASSVSSDASSRRDDPKRKSSPDLIPDEKPRDAAKPDGPPAKKRKLSPPSQPPAESSPMYLGYFLVDNAWSTVKGTGYIKPGEEILIEREEINKPPPPPPKKLAKKGADGKKQLTIATMFKPAPAKPSAKKKQDSVVRLTNAKGFDIVEFQKCTVVECPAKLTTGADLIISLSIYMKPSAFCSPSSSSEDKGKVMFNEGQETEAEQILRERKRSLISLFKRINLKPRKGNDSVSRAGGKLNQQDLELLTQQRPGALKPTQSGNAEDEEEGDITEDQINLIYRKAQQNDSQMGGMDPADTFTMMLRGYQRQALLWMHSIETGAASAREAQSMHPLWKEYAFPLDPNDEIMDLTADERPFYFNEYSGELSLEFPKAERKCKGGILADGNEF